MKTILSGASAFRAHGDVVGNDQTAWAGSAHFSMCALSWNFSSQRASSTTFSKPPNHSFVVAIPRMRLQTYDAPAAASGVPLGPPSGRGPPSEAGAPASIPVVPARFDPFTPP